MAAQARIVLTSHSPTPKEPAIETRLIIASLLFAILGLVAIAGVSVIARACLENARLRK